jgi:hypothetical protein
VPCEVAEWEPGCHPGLVVADAAANAFFGPLQDAHAWDELRDLFEVRTKVTLEQVACRDGSARLPQVLGCGRARWAVRRAWLQVVGDREAQVGRHDVDAIKPRWARQAAWLAIEALGARLEGESK